MAFSIGDELVYQYWMLCDEQRRVIDLGPSGRYPHTFLIADDGEPFDFANYFGKTVEEAMHLEINEITTLQSDEPVSADFDIVQMSIDEVSKLIIQEPIKHTIHLCSYGYMNCSPFYDDKIIIATNSYIRSGSKSAIQEAIDSAQSSTWGVIKGLFTITSRTASRVQFEGTNGQNPETFSNWNSIEDNTPVEFVEWPVITNV